MFEYCYAVMVCSYSVAYWYSIIILMRASMIQKNLVEFHQRTSTLVGVTGTVFHWRSLTLSVLIRSMAGYQYTEQNWDFHCVRNDSVLQRTGTLERKATMNLQCVP
jgi:hypothetical protein